jgi:hypothetical protein
MGQGVAGGRGLSMRFGSSEDGDGKGDAAVGRNESEMTHPDKGPGDVERAAVVEEEKNVVSEEGVVEGEVRVARGRRGEEGSEVGRREDWRERIPGRDRGRGR